MSRAFRHILFPLIAPLLFFIVASIPVAAIGCRNRGLLAVFVALSSLIASLVAASLALKGRLGGDPHSRWWIVSSLILAIPAVALLILA